MTKTRLCRFVERKLAFCLLWTAWLCGYGVLAQPAPRQILHGHIPPVTMGLKPLRSLAQTNQLRLAMGLLPRDAQGMAELLREIYNPGSTNFHHFLTLEEFTRRFGPSSADYQAVQAFAASNHLAVTRTYPNRLVLDVRGAVADVQRALHVTMRVYQHPTEAREFFAPDSEPSLNLATPVLHIGGLDNCFRPRPLFVKKSFAAKRAGATPALGSGPGGTYLGYDFRSAYLPGVPLTGAGQTVGLLEFDSGYYQSDITAYENLAGLPNIPVTPVLLNGYGGGPGSGNDEVSLDIEMAMSMAPGLQGINVYEGGVVDSILGSMASATSVKQFGASWTYSIDAESDVLFQEMALQGQSFFNASGDADAYVNSVPQPTDDTNITIVGGTTLSTSGPGGYWTSEKVWNWGGGSGGSGGISASIGLPSWQTGISMTASQGSITHRNLPDVALTGDNVWTLYGDGSAELLGGTSCATPLWAGFLALVNQQAAANGLPAMGFVNPALYGIGKSANYTNCFHDIVLGNNTWSGSPNAYYAVPGYDLCTGWGTPAGESLIDALAPDALGLAPQGGLTASGAGGGPFAPASVTFYLTNRGATTLNWSCGNATAWLAVAPASGTLVPGQTTSITISLNAAATALAGGVYRSNIWFTNVGDGMAQVVQNVLSVNPAPDLKTYPAALLSCHPLAYWQLNETNVPPAADVVSNSGWLGQTGSGFPFNSVAQGQPGIVKKCVEFSNPSQDVSYLGAYIDIPYNPSLNFSGAFTVEFWAKPNQSPTDLFCPVSSIDDTENNGNSRDGWIFYASSGNEWAFRVGNSSGYVAELSGGTLQPGVWQHIAGVYNGSTVTLYVNGVAVAGPTSAGGYQPDTNASVTLRLGATSFGNRTFDGAVDELAVYTNALSASVISAHAKAAATNNAGYGTQILTAGPVGYWHLDEAAYTTPAPGALPIAFNIGSLSYLADGIYQPGAIPGLPGVPLAGFGGLNLACSFPAVSYIDVPGAYLGLTGAMALTAWIKAPPGAGQLQTVAGLGAGSYNLTVNAQGHPQFVDGTQSLGALTATNIVDDNQWHQLTGVYDGTNTELLYVDGRLTAQSSSATAKPLANGNDFWIGNDPDSGVFQFFNGLIDEVAIFTNVLSPDQVAWLYSDGLDATRVTGLQTMSQPGKVSLTWAAIPGENYVLQSCTNLNGNNWTNLTTTLKAASSILTITDTPAATGQKFYRVLLAP